MKEKSLLSNIFNFVSNIILFVAIAVICINLFLIINGKLNKNGVPSVFGYSFLIEISDSMLPELEVGDLLIISDEDEYKVSDVISFEKDDVIITHRIVDEVKQNGKTYFKTKGDNNKSIDNDLVSANDVFGKVIVNVAVIGNVMLFLSTPGGFVILILVVVILFLVGKVIEMIKKEKNEKI